MVPSFSVNFVIYFPNSLDLRIFLLTFPFFEQIMLRQPSGRGMGWLPCLKEMIQYDVRFYKL